MDFIKGLCGLAVLWTVGCTPLNLQSIGLSSLSLRSQDADKEHKPDKDKDEDEQGEFSTKTNTPLIGEYTQVTGTNVIVLHGVGLVTGLDGTGGDPPTSMYRTAMLEDMRRRGVKNPNEFLRSPNNALVVVRAYLPPLIDKGEKFDVEVRAVDGSEIKSLNGGRLMETYLIEQALVPGRGILTGHTYAMAEGPVLVSMDGGSGGDRAALLKQGRVVAGGVSKIDRDLTLFLRNDFRSYRNSIKIAQRIGDRFNEYNEYGQKKPLAEAKTDTQVELKVQGKYKDNFPRYLQVIRNIAYRETPVALQVRMRNLKEQLLDPTTAEDAAIKLEAVGEKAVPVLKSGLQSPSLEVRFHAAMALAYLGEPEGLNDLATAVRDEPAFRVFALAAMATVQDGESHRLLRQLMNEPSAEARYGAFRALSTLDKNDPFVRGEPMGENFRLHALATGGPPLVHLTNRRKSEVVLFGADQRFKPPLIARAGLRILVTAEPGSDTVTVSRFEVNHKDLHRTVSTRVSDVIKAAVDLGASYPDIAHLLAQAGAQHNLPGRIEIDALPQAGRVYTRPDGETASTTKLRAHVGNSNLIPNLFSAFDDPSAAKDNSSAGKDQPGDPPQDKSDEAAEKKAAKTERQPQQKSAEDHAEKDADTKPLKGNQSRADAGPAPEKTAGKPRSEAAKSDDPPVARSESGAGWNWNPLRFFRGAGQTEPDVE